MRHVKMVLLCPAGHKTTPDYVVTAILQSGICRCGVAAYLRSKDGQDWSGNAPSAQSHQPQHRGQETMSCEEACVRSALLICRNSLLHSTKQHDQHKAVAVLTLIKCASRSGKVSPVDCTPQSLGGCWL